MASRKSKKTPGSEPAVAPSKRTEAQRASKRSASAQSMKEALEADKKSGKTPKVTRPKSSAAKPKKPSVRETVAAQRMRTEREANTIDFLNDWMVDERGKVLGVDDDHRLTEALKKDPDAVSRVLADYNLEDLPTEVSDKIFGAGYVPAEYGVDEETGKRVRTSDPYIAETVSTERGTARDIDVYEDFDPSQDPDYGSAERTAIGEAGLSAVLGSAGLSDVNTEQQRLDADAERELKKYIGVTRGMGPLTRGKTQSGVPNAGAAAAQGGTNTPSTVVPRSRRRLARVAEINKMITDLKPTQTVRNTRLVDTRNVPIQTESFERTDPKTGETRTITEKVVSAEDALRATQANKQSILSRDQMFDLLNEGSLAAVPEAYESVKVQEEVPLSPEDVATPDVPVEQRYAEQGVQSVGSAREEARVGNTDRSRLGTFIAKLSDTDRRNRLVFRNRQETGLTYLDENATRAEDPNAPGGTKPTYTRRNVFERPKSRSGDEPRDEVMGGALTQSTIDAINDAGWGGLFGGSLTQGGARIGRPRGAALSGVRVEKTPEGGRRKRRVRYNTDQFGRIYETNTDTGEVTERTDISVQRSANVSPDTPLADADVELRNPLDTGTINPLSDEYMPKTMRTGQPWKEVADVNLDPAQQAVVGGANQVQGIKEQQATKLEKAQSKAKPDTPQSLIESQTSFPRGTKRKRKGLGTITEESVNLVKPTPTSIRMATRSTKAPAGQVSDVDKLAESEGMSTEDVVESLRKTEGYNNLLRSLMRQTDASPYKERIFESTTRPGGVTPSTFIPQRVPIKTATGAETRVEVMAPRGRTPEERDQSIAELAPRDEEGNPIIPKINSAEEDKFMNLLGFIDPETKKQRFHTPNKREVAASNRRAKAAETARVAQRTADSEAARAASVRDAVPRPADVDQAEAFDNYKDLRTGLSAQFDVLGQVAQHTEEQAMYDAVNRMGAGAGSYNQNVRTAMPPPTSTSTIARVNAAKMATTGKRATDFDLRYHEMQRENLPKWTRGKGGTGGLSTAEQDEYIIAGGAETPNEGAFSTEAFEKVEPPSWMRSLVGGQRVADPSVGPQGRGFNPERDKPVLTSVQFSQARPAMERRGTVGTIFERSDRSGNATGFSHDPTNTPMTTSGPNAGTSVPPLLTPVIRKPAKESKKKKNQ